MRLKHPALDDPVVGGNLLALFARHGAPAERIDLMGSSTRADVNSRSRAFPLVDSLRTIAVLSVIAVHAGIYAGGENQAARRKPHTEQNWIAPEWGWSWPGNRRILYNRASARPDGTPWSERTTFSEATPSTCALV